MLRSHSYPAVIPAFAMFALEFVMLATYAMILKLVMKVIDGIHIGKYCCIRMLLCLTVRIILEY